MKYEPKLPLYDHQRAALDKCGGKPAWAALLAMRTGKSATILADFGQLELDGRCKDLLVIAPGGVYRTWVKACEDHLSNDLRQRVLIHVWESGASQSKKNELHLF